MKNIFQKLLILTFAVMILLTVKVDAKADKYSYWTGNSWTTVSDPDYTSNPIEVTYKVKYCYEEAYKMIDLVNEQRKKAGVPELEAKDELMDVAMQRAAESLIYWSHTRPDGSESSSVSIFSDGENLHVGQIEAKYANESLVNSPGHYATMIDKSYVYAGYGCVGLYSNGDEYIGSFWVQIFSCKDNKYYENGFDLYHPENNKPVQWDKMTIGKRKNYTADFTARVNPKFLSSSLSVEFYNNTTGRKFFSSDGKMSPGFNKLAPEESRYIRTGDIMDMEIDVTSPGDISGHKKWPTCVPLTEDQYNFKVLTPSLCSYSGGKLKALKAGKAKLQFSMKADSSISTTVEFEIKNKEVKKGDTYTVSGSTYKITSTNKKTVEFKQTDSTKKSISIPKTVKIQGKSYKVTSISANAFKNNKTITSVMVGANVTSIGKNAFYGCRNLKKITVKSTKLKSVGKSALKGVHRKAVIKVPKSKFSKYKKLFKGKGQKKTVKIKK